MASVTPCVPCCTTPQTVSVPGPQGPQGPAGPGTVEEVTATDPLEVTGVPTVTPNVELTGIVPAANGGTGQNSLANAWTALYTAADAANDELPIAAGGTGANTADDARANLNADVIPEDPIQSTDTTNRSFTVSASPGVRIGTVEVPLTKAGTWLLMLTGKFDGDSFNPLADMEFHVAIYRTNNTAGLLPGGDFTLLVGNQGSIANLQTYGTIALNLLYTTANADDNLQLYDWQVNVDEGGELLLANASLVAIFIKD